MTKNFVLKPLLNCLSFCLLVQFAACAKSKYGKKSQSSPVVEKAACQQLIDIDKKYVDLIETPQEKLDEGNEDQSYPPEQIERAKLRLADREALLVKFPDDFSCEVPKENSDEDFSYSREDLENEVAVDKELLKSEVAVPGIG